MACDCIVKVAGRGNVGMVSGGGVVRMVGDRFGQDTARLNQVGNKCGWIWARYD